MNNAAMCLCASQDTRRARADRSQGEGQATASPDDDDEDNADDSEGQIDDKKRVLISKQLMPSHDQLNLFWIIYLRAGQFPGQTAHLNLYS